MFLSGVHVRECFYIFRIGVRVEFFTWVGELVSLSGVFENNL